MTHGALHLFYAEHRVVVHHPFDVLVLRSKPLDGNVFESTSGDAFTRLLGLRARERLYHEMVVRIVALRHAGVDHLLHGCTDVFVGDLVVLGHQLPFQLVPPSFS